MRLDVYLTENLQIESRTRARNLIDMGLVSVNGKIIEKAGAETNENDTVEILGNYASSLGSLKLEHAIKHFNTDIENKVCIDIGAGNGGFTDILLLNNAKLVYAVDVGECALPEKILESQRVIPFPNTNARYLKSDMFELQPEFAVIDVSFISLTLILQPVANVISTCGQIVALIKPQFECTKGDLTKSGIVKSEKLAARACEKVTAFAKSIGLMFHGIIPAPRHFTKKNQEFLIFLSK